MELEKNNSNTNQKDENKGNKDEFKENKNMNSIDRNQTNENIVLTNGQEENYNLNFVTKRSYSCRINEPKNKNFSEGDDIKMNLNKKFLYLKTPQIKPKKSKLNPVPINIGSISCFTKKSKFNLLNNDDDNIMNDIISEGDNEESNEMSLDSSSDPTLGEEVKDNEENIDIETFDINENDLIIKKLNTDKKKMPEITEFKIIEENDDFDENGQLSLKNIRKEMMQSKRIFLKNDKDIFNRIDNSLSEHLQKFKEDILMGNAPSLGLQLHKTTGFGQTHPRKALPILEFLRKNSAISSIDKK
jgi:hypothetical protein